MKSSKLIPVFYYIFICYFWIGSKTVYSSRHWFVEDTKTLCEWPYLKPTSCMSGQSLKTYPYKYFSIIVILLYCDAWSSLYVRGTWSIEYSEKVVTIKLQNCRTFYSEFLRMFLVCLNPSCITFVHKPATEAMTANLKNKLNLTHCNFKSCHHQWKEYLFSLKLLK